MSSNLIKLIYSLNNEESSVAFDPSNKIGSLKTLINLTQKINLDDYEVFYRKKEIKWTDETPIKNIIGKENVPIFYIKLKASKSNEANKNPDNKSKEDKKTDKLNENDKKPESGKATNTKEQEKKPDPKAQKEEPKKTENKPAAQGKEAEKNLNNKVTVVQDKKNDPNKSRPNSVDENSKELTHLKCKVIVEDFPSRPEFYEIIDKYKANKQVDHEMHLLNIATGVEITFKNPVRLY